MRKILTLLAVLVLLASPAFIGAQANVSAQTTEKQSNKVIVTFYLSMHCHNCLNKLNKNLPFVKGVLDYKADLEQKSVVVTYDKRKTNEETLKQELEKLDFIVTKDKNELLKLMK